MTITFTRLQADEILYKLAILADEPDLLESYEITEEQAADLLSRYRAALDDPRRDPQIDPSDWEADILIGEFRNCIEIAEANIESGDSGYFGYAQSIRSAIRKIEKEMAKS